MVMMVVVMMMMLMLMSITRYIITTFQSSFISTRLDKFTIHNIHLQVKRITIQDSVGDMLQNEKG